MMRLSMTPTQPTQPNNLFDLAESQRQRDMGMSRAASVIERKEILLYARRVARRICLEWGSVTSDDVAQAMQNDGIDYAVLGNAAGSVFRDDAFTPTGEVRQSTRITSHARIMRVWKLADTAQ